MIVKLLTCLAGPDGTGNAGENFKCSDELGEALIKQGYAEAVPGVSLEVAAEDRELPIETAQKNLDNVEVTTPKRGKGKRGSE
jgi:hypothetical protein